MHFRIADTFTASLARLTGDEQKAVKTTAFDLQLDPANPGMQFHKLDRARDRNFWSVRVNRDIRLIVHRTKSSLLLCYVGHHDDAYAWAERRKLEMHPTTGAAQIVEIRERVREGEVPRYVASSDDDARPAHAAEPAATPSPHAVAKEPAPTSRAAPPLFTAVPDDDLLAYGVPPEWLPEVRAATEGTLLELADHLPAEAAEALLALAVGGMPVVPEVVHARALHAPDPFEHPDARRRFRTIADSEELERALAYPWDRWSVFLHPAQRDLVHADFAGPAHTAYHVLRAARRRAAHQAASPGPRRAAPRRADRGPRARRRRPAALRAQLRPADARAARGAPRAAEDDGDRRRRGPVPPAFPRCGVGRGRRPVAAPFQPPFSWRSLGVDVRGRSHTLRVNDRTSHQIRRQMDRLLPRTMADVDGLVEDRGGTVSVVNGPEPTVALFDDEAVPLASRLAVVVDDADVEEVYDAERSLLYVGARGRGMAHLAMGGAGIRVYRGCIFFEILGEIQDPQTIATGTNLRVRKHLLRVYGKGARP